ncbi:MAG TPA: thioredoxin family protein [Gaiellaceae bacterium]|nr:thioredoxin family protein [Gaiellaceae bacterium]
MRPSAALTVLSSLLLVGCGGSSGETGTTAADPGGGRTLEELWRAPGDDVAIVSGTANHEPGDVRISFLVIDAEERVVTLPSARVWVADGLEAPPFLESSAKLERIGVPGGDVADASHIYVARLRLPRPGTYWLLAEPEGGATAVQALGNVVVVESDSAPDIGDPAIASDTPTIASTGRDLAKLTTRTPPDEPLLEHSIAESLRSKTPFVVTFATPKFCSSRTCGPVVDVVEEVASRFEEGKTRFIHVEVYEGNDPANGYNRWMREWGLETEPWTFLVGSDGKIVERYEGVVSVNELETAVRAELDG